MGGPARTRSLAAARLRAWLGLLSSQRRRAAGADGAEVRERVSRGVVLLRETWLGARRHGPAASWWPDGTKRSQGSHRDGRRDGEWFFFLPDGALDRARTGLYRDGVRIGGIRGFNEWLGSP